jgi:hypothetical protein
MKIHPLSGYPLALMRRGDRLIYVYDASGIKKYWSGFNIWSVDRRDAIRFSPKYKLDRDILARNSSELA